MREMEIVPHPQIEGIHVFFNTVDYRTPHMHHEFELVWVVEETLRCLPPAPDGPRRDPCSQPAPNGEGSDCSFLLSTYGLTARECEVALLLAKGRSLPFIQEELHIAQGTAQTHLSHIYRKLGVHSRQEFLDVIEAHRNTSS